MRENCRVEENAHAGIAEAIDVGHFERIPIGGADGVVREKHAIVGMIGFSADDRERRQPGPHRGSQLLGEPSADGAESYENDALSHGLPPRRARARSCA